MRRPEPERRARRELARRHERALALLYLLGVVVLAGAAAAGPVRRAALGGAERALRRWDARWTDRLAHGESLVAAGRYADGVTFLAELDRVFPARNVRHARDRERERLLTALGAGYEGLGRKGQALEAYRRLVGFDGRNYQNHVTLAEAALRLGEPDTALAHLAHVLAIHPNHLPSVRAVVRARFEDGDFAGAAATFERYLAAQLFQRLEVSLGDTTAMVRAAVDGEAHDVELVLARPAGWSGTLGIATGGLAVQVLGVRLDAPVVVARASPAAATELVPGAALRAHHMSAARGGVFRGDERDASLALAVPPQPDGVARVRLRLRLLKPVDPELWTMVATSYGNRLDPAGLAAAESRLVVSPTVAHADRVVGPPE